MLTPLPLGLGLRYARARQHAYFVSFISWVSLAGIALGVAALIAILSVMNGFEGELRTRLLSLSAHATLPAAPDAEALRQLAERAREQPGVVSAEPFVEVQGLLSNGSTLSGAVLRGIDARDFRAGTPLADAMIAGDLAALTAGSGRVVLGRVLAAQLRAAEGTPVSLLLLRAGADGALAPRIGGFTTSGEFEIGLADHDSTLAFASLEDVAALAGPSATAGVRVFYADPFDAPARTPALASALGLRGATDWTGEHTAYFRAIRIEKAMMAVILLLIVAVAAFNIVASLVMVVSEKRNDIAILRTLGFSRGGVVSTFIVQGTLIGWIGAVAGILLGVVLALNAGDIVQALERLFGFQVFDPAIYYISRVPSELRAVDVLVVSAIAFALTLLATVYPARKAAATEPAEALRYE
ncbi:MAG TPA: lipoprotein-releasing ABC transporter permease subunit [Steroidobacteraceae bacterium]|nr:lipoprotein-releasing ABC transporter permease subunit [Steroidobacteraceae bacterium]